MPSWLVYLAASTFWPPSVIEVVPGWVSLTKATLGLPGGEESAKPISRARAIG